MISGSPQSFDLLGLGAVEPITGGIPIAPASQNADAQAFGNILNLLLGDTTADTAPFMTPAPEAKGTIDQSVQKFVEQFASNFAAAAAELPQSPECDPVLESCETPPTENADVQAVQSAASTLFDLPVNSAATLVKSQMQQTLIGPNCGTHVVVDSKVKGDFVEFTLRPQAKPSETMVLSLPASALKDVTSLLSIPGTVNSLSSRERIGVQPVRVSLGESTETSRMVAAVLSKLNVRELVIDQPSHAAQQAAVKPEATVTLVGEFNAAPVQLKFQVEPGKLRIKSSPLQSGTDPVVATETGRENIPSNNQAVRPVAAQPSTDSPRDWTANLTREFSLPRKALSVKTVAEPGNIVMPSSVDSGSTALNTRETLVPVQQVKFTLPDLSPKTMIEAGRSVTIKIEPDYLGPARLHLSVANDALTARVTVDTPQAKALVESSLDRLTEQLNRAGVTVNRIEVSLSNNGAGQQFADQQANWHRPNRMPYLGKADLFSLTGETAPKTTLSPMRQYVYARSVNLYA